MFGSLGWGLAIFIVANILGKKKKIIKNFC
jgi:hypothetical protein